MRLTERQAQALESVKHVVLRAGAGSGKTSVLTERYITLLENKLASINEIIAITFTEKAANQMKEKIREKVRAKIENEAVNDNNENVVFWETMYEKLPEARISTIHSFCSSILRDDPVSVGVDPSFEIMDENLSSLKLQESITAVLDQESENLSEDICRLPEDWGRSRIEEILRELVSKGPGILKWAHEYSTATDTDIRERWKNAAEKRIRNIVNPVWIEAMFDALSGINCNDPQDKQADNFRIASKWIGELRTNIFDGDILSVSSSDAADMNFTGGKAAAWDGDGLDRWKGIRNEIRDVARELGGFSFSEADEIFLLSAPALARLYLKVISEFRERCGEGRFIGFDELQVRALTFLKENRSAANEIKRGFKYVMVDEFQDTNPMQWDIVKTLAGTADGNFDKNVFIVGDEKQSIYGFRGADVKVFGKAQDEISSGAEPGCVDVSLDINFRSHPELVEFFNILFENIFVNRSGAPSENRIMYENVLAGRKDASSEKKVEFICMSKDAAGEFGGQHALEAEMVARRLCEMLRGEKPLMISDGNGGIRILKEEDVAVLFRKTTHVDKYEDAFRRHGLSFINLGGYGFFDSTEITDIMNVLKFLYDPRNEVCLAGVLRGPLFGLSDETLLKVSMCRERTFFEKFTSHSKGVDADERTIFAHKKLLFWRRAAGCEKTPDLITRILDETGAWGIYGSGERGGQALLNIEKLLELSAGFEVSEGGGLARFMRWYEMKMQAGAGENEAQMSGEEGGGIRFLTVHRAKGLEFPVVVVQNASFEYGKSGGSKIVHITDTGDENLEVAFKVFEDDNGAARKSNPVMYKVVTSQEMESEALEEKRLLYVACTRAMEKLIIAGCGEGLSDGSIPGGENARTWTSEMNNALSRAGVRDKINKLAEWILPDDFQKIEVADDNIRICDFEQLKNLFIKFKSASTDKKTSASLHCSCRDGLNISVTELNSYITSLSSEERKRDYINNYIIGVPPSWRWHGSGQGHHHHPAISPVVRGEAVHRLFEELHSTSGKNIREKLTSILLEMNVPVGREMNDVVNKYTKAAEQFLQSPEGAAIAGANVMKEVPFLLEAGCHKISGKIDLLTGDDAGAWKIIDYKTNIVKKGDENKTLEEYRTQLEVYALAVMKAMSTKQPVSATLYFTETGGFSESVIVANNNAESMLQTLAAHIDDIQSLKESLLDKDNRF